MTHTTQDLSAEQIAEGWKLHDGSGYVPDGLAGAIAWQGAWFDRNGQLRPYEATSNPPIDYDWHGYSAYRTFRPSPAPTNPLLPA